MKTHLVKTLSITLLLSIPFTAHAAPTLIKDQTPCHPQGLNPFEQRTQVNSKIASIQDTIANLKKQHDAIEPQKAALTLASSDAKGDNKALLAQTGEKIRDLDALAAQTSKLIWAKQAEIKVQQQELLRLAARIATLEPSTTDLPSITIETFRKEILPAIQGWKKSDFTYCKTTKVSSEDKSKKIDQKTVVKSDKSAPYFIKEEQPKTWTGSIASGLSHATALVYAYPTIKVVTVPAGEGLADTFSFTKISVDQASSSSAANTTSVITDKK